MRVTVVDLGRMVRRHAMLALAVLLAANVAAGSEGRELGRVTAKAAIVIDAQTGDVHFARNPTLPLPPASTTKIVTAMLALRSLNPESVLPVSNYASSMPASKVYLRAGWQLNARDLLYAVMLRSANDASVVVAEGVGGSVPNFARMMNQTVRSLGALQSNFVTPNGLPAANHYSTARDLAIVMREALKTPGMREIMSTRTATIQPLGRRGKRISVRSTNRLLWRDDLHVIGKTGWTRQAKRCFVGAATANGREVIVAVLGSSDLWGDVETLVTYGLAQGTPGTWRDEAGWQQAAAPNLGPRTAWARPALDGTELASVAPPARPTDERRAMRKSALVAPATSRRAKAVRKVPQAQGDGVESRRGKLRYSIHLASFQSKVRADRLRQDLSKRGYQATVEPVAGSYRVSVPGFASRDSARKAARRLSRALHVDPVIVASK